MKIGVAGIPGAWSTEVLAAALLQEGVEVTIFSLGDCTYDLAAGQVTWNGKDLSELDAIVVKKLGQGLAEAVRLRLNVLRRLEALGVRVFSPVEAIAAAVDRYRQTAMLAEAGLPVPPTVVTEDSAVAVRVVETYGRVVLKPIFTSKGRGMVRLKPGTGLAHELEEWRREYGGPFYLQQFMESSGRDIGVAVLGEQVLGAYYRQAVAGEWMTTTDAGGRYLPATLSPGLERLAGRAAAVSGLDYTVVDIVETPSGPYIYEVSALGGFRGLWEAAGINAAGALAQYVVKNLTFI